MRKTFLLFVCLLLFNPFPAVAEQTFREFSGEFTPQNNGERLLAFLVSVTDPESLELQMDALPGDDGAIRAVSFALHGGALGGFRIERLTLESAFIRLNPPSEWIRGNRHSLRVRNALRSNFELVIDEHDILEALKTYASGSWSRISVDLTSGELRIQGRYKPGATGFSLMAGITTRLELRDGKRVMLKAPEIRINGENKTSLFQRDLERLRPVLDFNGFPPALTISRLSVDKGKLLLATATRPKAVGGIRYRYVRDLERPFSIHPPESFDFAERQFRNGDIVLVGGKTWRSKIVNLFEDGNAAFSHSGIVRIIGGVPYIIHASPESELVRMERAETFLSPKKVDRASIYRLRGNPGAAETAGRKALEYYEERVPFDTAFDSEDHERLYCTELIWRAYTHAGIDLADGLWYSLYNPVLSGRLLLPNSLTRSPLLEETAILR
ncbi:MAG TPA: LmeA family phospholipid-binding protein [Synergistales bacterium]|nr:LmeA family phospholipid-binding protein [Synergistales bacterium]